jgi:hypothetical protein
METNTTTGAAAERRLGRGLRQMRKQPVLEKYVVARIMKALKQQRGVVVRKRHGTAMGVAGDPDLYGSIDGRHFEIEVKRPDDPASIPTQLQAQRMQEWRDAGALVGIARSAEDALAILDITSMDSEQEVRS